MSKKTVIVILASLPVLGLAWLIPGLDAPTKVGLDAVVVAVAALIVAILHAMELERVTGELHGVARSMQTRSLGVFPEYLPDVAELVADTKQSLKILCDTPAHGVFSNTAAFEEYWRNLRLKMVEGIEIECAFFDAPSRKKMHELQIRGDRTNWDGWQKRNRSNCEAFDRFARAHRIPPTQAHGENDPVETWGAKPEDYVKSMMAVNEFTLSCFNGYEPDPLEIDDPRHEGPSVYLWLRDRDQEAVFVFVPVRGIGVDDFAGFRTKEPALIQALNTAYTRRSEGA